MAFALSKRNFVGSDQVICADREGKEELVFHVCSDSTSFDTEKAVRNILNILNGRDEIEKVPCSGQCQGWEQLRDRHQKPYGIRLYVQGSARHDSKAGVSLSLCAECPDDIASRATETLINPLNMAKIMESFDVTPSLDYKQKPRVKHP